MTNKMVIWDKVSYKFDPIEKRYNSRDISDYEKDLEYKFDEEEDELSNLLKIDATKYVTTPAGIFQLEDALNPIRQFEFFQGHTNFRITEKDFSILNNTNGIEFLRVISPHRFIIAIGKCFNFKDVCVDIVKALGATHEKDKK